MNLIRSLARKLARPERPALFGAPAWTGRSADDLGINAGFGSGGAGSGAVQGTRGRIQLYPYAIWGQTALAANATGVTCNAAIYANQSGFPFYVTHLSLSEGGSVDSLGAFQPLSLAPRFGIKVDPESGLKWMQDRVTASAALSSRVDLPAGPGRQVSKWSLPSPYRIGRGDGFYVAATNPDPVNPLTVSISIVGYKDNAQRTPRFLWAELTLPAGASETSLPGNNFRNDGDFDLLVTDVIVSSGAAGDWQANAVAPLILIRPQSSGPGFMPFAVQATALNLQPSLPGALVELRNPQPIYSGQAFKFEMSEQTGVATIANVGVLGYLEIPAQ